jgi:hypothetical protein
MSEPGTGLAAQQRGLLALLKGRPVTAGADAYLDLVSGSQALAMLQTITAWWRRFDLARSAPLTSRVLTRAGRFEDALSRLGSDQATPSGTTALAMHFLEGYAGDADPLVRAVASTERALALVARGDRSEHRVCWDRDPTPVLNALLADGPLQPAVPGDFRVTVSSSQPALIAVEHWQTES